MLILTVDPDPDSLAPFHERLGLRVAGEKSSQVKIHVLMEGLVNGSGGFEVNNLVEPPFDGGTHEWPFRIEATKMVHAPAIA